MGMPGNTVNSAGDTEEIETVPGKLAQGMVEPYPIAAKER
jgi:hypothetical protein